MSEIRTFGPWRARPQPFEAEFFGGPVWRLDAAEATAAELKEGLAEATAAAREARVRLMSARTGDEALGATLGGVGFSAIETLITFRRALTEPAPAMPSNVGHLREGDERPLAQIGRSAFTQDRFHADPQILDPIADAIKGAWVENGLHGRADVVLVAHHEDRPVGFNLCFDRGDEAVIDLIAVEHRCQGSGLGTAMVQGAIAHFTGKAKTLYVGTQATNTASLKMYRRCGFEVDREAKTYHWHP